MTPLLRLFPALVLAGCATAPAGPAFTLHSGDRVGMLVETSDVPVHTHYQSDGGSAVRSARAYPYSWQLDSAVGATVLRELTQAGFNVVDLETQGLRHADLAGLVTPGGRQWQAASDPLYARLREQGVRAVVLVRDARTLAVRDCIGGPCERIAEGPGLYSSNINGVTTWRAVSGFEWRVFLLDPPGDLAASPSLRASLRMPSMELLGAARPPEGAPPTETELMLARERVLDYVEATAEDAVLALGGRRVVEHGAVARPGGQTGFIGR